MSSENLVWVERYRPDTVDDCILPERIKAEAKSLICDKDLPNLLLSGPAGTGKTSLARAMCRELGYELRAVNGSNEGRLLDTLRTTIDSFASSMSFTQSRKAVLLDEADYIPRETVQPALRAAIENYATTCSFIFTCNYRNRLMDAIHSRCKEIDFTMTKEERMEVGAAMFKRVKQILQENDIEYDKEVLVRFVMASAPDWRKMLNNLQSYASKGVIDTGILTSSGTRMVDELVPILKDRRFTDMLKWVGTTANLDMKDLIRALSESMEHVGKESRPDFILLLAKYQAQHHNALVEDVNIKGMLTELMMTCSFK